MLWESRAGESYTAPFAFATRIELLQTCNLSSAPAFVTAIHVSSKGPVQSTTGVWQHEEFHFRWRQFAGSLRAIPYSYASSPVNYHPFYKLMWQARPPIC